MRAQTYAFTVLGMSQLFHAVGMRSIHTSVFRMHHLRNKLMLAALVIGLGLQFAVTEIPLFIRAFGTVHLLPVEWGFLLILAAFPLLAHEIMLLLRPANKKEAAQAAAKERTCLTPAADHRTAP